MKCLWCKFRKAVPGLKYFGRRICGECLEEVMNLKEIDNDEAGSVSEVDGQKSLSAGDGGGLPNCS